ncbi:hypothetical protein JW766_04295 [Candidatus Dojkabacteria bacterium]|nr:hypothetical protein [Candidatus Dojkabacteria bacterium]
MDKLFGSLPIICCLVGGFIIVAPFTVLVLYLLNKGRKSSWNGKIVDKLHKVGTDDDGRDVHYYTLVVKTEEDKTLKIGVSYEEYNQFKVGDKLEKKSGQFKPQKVS